MSFSRASFGMLHSRSSETSSCFGLFSSGILYCLVRDNQALVTASLFFRLRAYGGPNKFFAA
jgi:hypothetical protein